MARNKNNSKNKRTSKKEALFWGLPVDKWREIAAFCLLSLAVLLLFALISEDAGKSWIGAVGHGLAGISHFLVGRYVAYVLPALFILAGIHAFQGRIPFHPLRKIVAGMLILLSLCGMFALPAILSAGMEGRGTAYDMGGAIGGFLISREGLGISKYLGPAGAWIVLGAAFLLGIMLSTEFLFTAFISRMVEFIKRQYQVWKQHKPVAILKFNRERRAGSSVFPKFGNREAPALEGPSLDIRPNSIRFDKKEQDIEPEPDKERAKEEAEEKPEEKSEPDIFLNIGPSKKKKEAPPEPMGMVQTELDFSAHDFEKPSLDLFSHPPESDHHMDREEVIQISGELEKSLGDFGISAKVVGVTQGPVVTQYELEPAAGVKVKSIENLEKEIAMALRAKSVRIQAPIPGKAAVGIEVPNRKVTSVFFRELIETPEFLSHKSALAFVIGKNISGEPVICDLATMPHLLIAGTTGSGKSVCVNGIISSFLFRMPPDKVKFIMIDPKRVELNVYSDIPHLLAPVVNEPRQAASALMWAVQQMEERLKVFSKMRVRNIDGYNEIITGKRKTPKGIDISEHKALPHIVIVIDELADLMMIARKEVEDFIVRLAQMSRAAGIHMVIATQRPSVNVLTGLIKANFPSRIAFRVSAKVDSRTILDMNGAETLLGRGDMLFSPGGIKPMRLQGAFLSDADVEKLTDHLRAQKPEEIEQTDFSMVIPESNGDQAADDGIVLGGHSEDAKSGDSAGDEGARVSVDPVKPVGQVEFPELVLNDEVDEDEELYEKALRMILESGKPSVSMIQRRLKIGFARAGRLMDLMEERGIVGPYQGSKPRDLIVEDPEALLRRLNEIERDRATGSV
ncbi:MAG: DNA translocase FtsK [Candidatus Sumerlaeia bacterium]